MVTEQEARDMKTAIDAFQVKDRRDEQIQFDADKAVALTWFNGLGIDIQGATTRTQALANFTQIESLLKTETDRFRLFILRGKLDEANEKYKQIKAVNPNS